MVVCHCRRVNDRTITELAARYAATMEEVCGRSGAGTHCGGCRETILMLLEAGLPDQLPVEVTQPPSPGLRFRRTAVPSGGSAR